MDMLLLKGEIPLFRMSLIVDENILKDRYFLPHEKIY